MQEAEFVVDGSTPLDEKGKLPYVSPWKIFSKLPDDEKERIFNAMRERLILDGRMEKDK